MSPKGFEGYQARNIGELVNGNLWNSDTAIKTLPFFQNMRYNRDGVPARPDLERMKKRLLEIAVRIGVDTAGAASEVSLQWEGVEIEGSSDLTATIRFDPTLCCPMDTAFHIMPTIKMLPVRPNI